MTVNEYNKVVSVKYTDAHIVPAEQEIPLEVAELIERIRLCDGNCNECPLMFEHPSNRMLTFILNKALNKFGDEFYELINKYCTNLTCCNECRVDDFVHVEGCTIMEAIDSQNSTPKASDDE